MFWMDARPLESASEERTRKCSVHTAVFMSAPSGSHSDRPRDANYKVRRIGTPHLMNAAFKSLHDAASPTCRSVHSERYHNPSSRCEMVQTRRPCSVSESSGRRWLIVRRYVALTANSV